MGMFYPSYQLDIILGSAGISAHGGPISNKGYSLSPEFSITLECAKPPLLHSRQAIINFSTGLGLGLGSQFRPTNRESLESSKNDHDPQESEHGARTFP